MNDPLSNIPPPMGSRRPSQHPPVALDDFIPNHELDRLINDGGALRAGCILTTSSGPRYALQEAVRVLGNISHETDPYGFTGLVETVGSLLKRGFVMSAERIALGRSVYDVEYGWLAQPFHTADESGVNPKVV
jgi:hypothetical protein